VKWRIIAVLLCFAFSYFSWAQSVEPSESIPFLWDQLNQKLDDLQTSFDLQANQIDSFQSQLTEDKLLLTKQDESLTQARTYSLILEKSLSSSRKLNKILGWGLGIVFALALGEGLALTLR
jgi:hypothetical protein